MQLELLWFLKNSDIEWALNVALLKEEVPDYEYLLIPIKMVYLQVLSEKERAELREMPYREFLKTWYWQAVRGAAKWRDEYEYKLCCSSDNLQVHHRDYRYRGQEHLYLEDLTTLCADCHAEYHLGWICPSEKRDN